MRPRTRPIALATLLVLGWPTAARAQVLDDFESAGAPAPWTFSNGAEFPGATGALTLGAGHAGHGAHLAYDFSGGGQYVAIARPLPNVALGQGLALYVHADPRIDLTLRLTDATGQTIQYGMQRPLESIACGDWCPMLLPADAPPRDHWGGANDGVLHGPLTGIAIVLGHAAWAPAVGAIDVDELAVVQPATFTLEPFANGAALPAASADLFARWGVAVHDTSDAAALDAMAAAGFAWVRTDMSWSAVESHAGVYDFSGYDTALAAIEARHMKAVLILDYGNTLYGGGPPITTAAIHAFGNYAQAAAAHFAGHDVIFEVWNEPDGNGFWPPGNQPLQYAALLREAIARVHAGDARAKVSTGGVSYFFDSYFDALLGSGAAQGADYVAVHAYGSDPPELAVGGFVQLRAMVAAALPTATPPVIGTEWGFSARGFGPDGTAPAARARQAVFAVRSQLATWVAGAPVAIWYDTRDDCTDGTNNECNFGLLAHDGTDKPAMRAIRALADAARGRRLTALLSTAPGPHVLRLEGADAVIVAWASGTGATATLRAPVPASATDVYGAALDTGPVSAGMVTLTLAEASGPVYLHYGRIAIPGPDAGTVALDGGGVGDGGSGRADGGGMDGGSSSGRSGGCGCRAQRPRGARGAVAAFAVLGLAWRRRRRAA